MSVMTLRARRIGVRAMFGRFGFGWRSYETDRARYTTVRLGVLQVKVTRLPPEAPR